MIASQLGRGPGLWAVVGLMIPVVFLYSGAVIGGRVFFQRDIHQIWHPQVEAFVRAVAAGSWPTWDPLSAFGQPLLADPSAQVLYPFTWLNLLLRPWTYYTVFVVTHVWLSGVGLYALARRWGMSVSGSYVAAGVWMAGGPFQSFVDLWHHFAGASWLPVVFLGAEVALESRRPVSVLLWGAAVAGQILAGSADMCAMTALAVGAYVALIHLRWRAGLNFENRRVLATCIGAALFGLCLSAAVWLPALDVVSRAARPELAYDLRTYWSLHPLSILDLVFPNVWSPFMPRPRFQFLRELREPFLGSLYLGIPAFGLVTAGLKGGLRSRAGFLLLLGTAATLVALGRHSGFYDLLIALLPPLRIFRYPVKAMILVGFSWALLAGSGFEALREPAPLRRLRLVLVAAPLAAIALVAWLGVFLGRSEPGAWAALPLWPPGLVPYARILRLTTFKLTVSGLLATAALSLVLAHGRAWPGTRRTRAALAVLVLGDLLAYHQYLALAPRLVFTHRPEILSVLERSEDPRLYVYDYDFPGESARRLGRPYNLARIPEGWSEEHAYALGLQMALAYATGGRWNLRGSYEDDYRGLQPRPLAELTLLLKRVENTPAYLKLLRMGAVTHVVTLHGQGQGDLVPLAALPGLFRAPILVFGVPDPLPRSYVIAETRILDGAKAVARLTEADWDPRKELILPDGRTMSSPAGFSGSARIVGERADRVTVEAASSDAGYLVLADTYDPGWRATVDGRPAPVLRANLVFRAVQLPAGRHVVEFRYRPPSLVAGLALSVAAALLGGGVVLASHARRTESTASGPARPHAS